MEAIITFCGQPMLVMCDGKCEKAWGMAGREKVKMSDDPDDFVFLADDELGIAPADPGTYEGGVAKPHTRDEFPNRWCVRQCERCVGGRPDAVLVLPKFDQRAQCY